MLKSTELFDPDKLVWASAGDLATGRTTGHTETLLRVTPVGGPFQPICVLVAGGYASGPYSNSLNSAEVYLSDDVLPPVA